MEKNKQIELRSEKVRNIIGQVPPILLRYGITIIALSLLMLIGIAAFIPYNSTIDTKVTISQDEKGALHYSANIPQDAMKKQPQFAGITTNFASDLPLPSHFQIQSISDVANVSEKGTWFVATLKTESSFSRNIKLENVVTVPAKIELEKSSVLKWMIGKVAKN